MPRFLSFLKEGKITSINTCAESDFSVQPGYPDFVLEIPYDEDIGWDTHYVELGQVIVKPDKPSSNHVFDYSEKQWIDLRSLPDHKAAKWGEIKQARSQAEYAGFTWDGSVFDSDALSQQRITGAVTLAQMDSSFEINWTLVDNTVRALNATNMKEVGTALGIHVATQFAHAQLLRELLDAATTVDEVIAVVWLK